MNVSAWSIRNPIPAVMLFVLLTFGGLLSFQAMKVQNFPDIDLPTVSVTASLPGAAPAQLETEVARKLENSIPTLQGLKHITTKVQDGGVTITAEFRLEKPVQEAVDDVRSAVARVRADLPGDVRDPIVNKLDMAGTPVLAFTVSADAMDEEALSWLTEQSQKDTRSGADTNVRQMADPTSAVNINMGTLVGSYASVARMLDEVAAVPGAEGVLLTFDDFLTGVETFGERIQPLMQCRAHIPAVTKEVA